MADKWVKSGQVLSFKTGLQSAVNTIIANGTGAVHGAFYLTQDSHRLYVGNDDGSLSPVNEGVTTIANMTALSAITPSDPDERKALTGSFYYLTNENILCVYNGSNWIRINQNTNNVINTFTFTADTTNNLINGLVGDDGNHTATGRFKVVGGDGVTVTYGSTTVNIDQVPTTVPTITVDADYSIGVVTDNNQTKIKLTSEDGTSNDTSFAVTAGNYTGETASNVIISNDNGNLKIAAKDTKITSITGTNNSTAGFDITLTDNKNTTQGMSTNIQPKIKYGVDNNAQATVDFIGGTATLNVYTKGEIDGIMTALNAMHYIGTWGDLTGNPSGASTIDFDTTPGEVHVYLDATEVDMHIGDVLLAQDSSRALGASGNRRTIYKGSLLIARSSDGTEDANGVIPPEKLMFDVVESTYDTDTRYRFVADENNQGIKLVTYNTTGTATTGSLLFTGGTVASDADGTTTNDMIKVTKSYSALDAGGSQQATITIKHKDVARNDTTATAITMATSAPSSTGSWRNSKSITVVTGVTTNESGHITGVETTSFTVSDTNSYFGANATTITTSAYDGTSNKRVGIIKNETTLTNPGNNSSTTTSYTAITSQSLSITDDDTQMTQSGGSQAASGLNIEMVWGSF